MLATYASSKLTAVNEPAYAFGSSDNVRPYLLEIDLSEGYSPNSIHGVLCEGQPLIVVSTASGATGIHQHSLLCVKERCYLAVGDHVVCFRTDPLNLEWTLKVDTATCFGVHYQNDQDALISHGEIEIVRFSQEGKLIWAASGADIFSEGFALKDKWVEAVDFYGRQYRFSYDSGAENV